MKRLLLVDDDAVVTRTYRDRLAAHGFGVATAASGAGALSFLASVKPDLVVLDLMMPEVSGVDVLKFLRGQRRLEATPVVVLANEVKDDLGRHAARIGIQRAFRKDQCSPTVLMAAIDEILDPRALAAARPPDFLTDPETPPDAPPPEATAAAGGDDTAQAGPEAGTGEARASFLADAAAKCADLGDLCAALVRESLTTLEQQDRLQDLFLKVRFLAEAADLAGLGALTQATAAFDALLNALIENPQRIGPSALRTLEGLVEIVGLLFQEARESGGGTRLSARVLVVDDDPVANEMVVAALGRAQLNARSTEDSVEAWQCINSEHFDLVLLRIEMPVLNGLQLRECLRTVPGYERTPVILIAAHDAPDTWATSAVIDADDLIAKPILPQELAARVLMGLVRTQMEPSLCSVGQITGEGS
jgi:DNA-binding response OmpR family regulator